MKTYLQITRGDQSLAYYFHIQISNDFIKLQQENGPLKSLSFEIPFSELKHLIIDRYLGVERVSFTYKDYHFTIYGNGTGVYDYIHNRLCCKKPHKIK